MTTSHYFSHSYPQARQQFLDAAQFRHAQIESIQLPGYTGADGEALYLDVALTGKADAQKLLLITSATHGIEGYCGSGCQVSLLHDDDIMQRLEQQDVALLMVHAVNPYGFSHAHRSNEENIDLNRNCIDFQAALPDNPDYAELHALLIPATWPADDATNQALYAWQVRHGAARFQAAITGGQYQFAEGLFYGGQSRSWSLRTLADVLTRYSAGKKHLGWIDLHTGLGPRGHGEKIYAGHPHPQELARARAWWGSDVVAPFEANSSSAEIQGPVAGLAYQLAAYARQELEVTLMALEFGTIPLPAMLQALRADHWLRSHPQATPELASAIKQHIRAAFYCEQDDWKGMILGQCRTAVVQAISGLGQN
jgi:hypothetical protein